MLKYGISNAEGEIIVPAEYGEIVMLPSDNMYGFTDNSIKRKKIKGYNATYSGVMGGRPYMPSYANQKMVGYVRPVVRPTVL